ADNFRASLHSDLRPPSRRCAQIDHTHAALQEMKLVVELDELVGRARAIAFRLRPRHVRIVELALDPLLRAFLRLLVLHARGEAAPAIAFSPRARPAPFAVILAHRRFAMSCMRTPSRRPRSATRIRAAGQTRRTASRMAPPATTRSARSLPMHAFAA